MDLQLVVSNHPDHAASPNTGVPYLHFPVPPDTKAEQVVFS